MGYKDVPHAAVNEVMKWVHKQGKQVVSLHTWPHLRGWSELPDWFAHVAVQDRETLHVRVKRKGYKFVVIHEPDDTLCPACCANVVSSLISQEAAAPLPEEALAAPQV